MFRMAGVDLFASDALTHCPLWVLLVELCSPLGQDALAHTWSDLLVYAFLPALHRIDGCNHSVLLITPYWPKRVWFPLLCCLLCRVPWYDSQSLDPERRPLAVLLRYLDKGLSAVLEALSSPPFEPLHCIYFRWLLCKTAFSPILAFTLH